MEGYKGQKCQQGYELLVYFINFIGILLLYSVVSFYCQQSKSAVRVPISPVLDFFPIEATIDNSSYLKQALGEGASRRVPCPPECSSPPLLELTELS